MKVAVIGVGYVGLVTGVCLAKLGHKVTCIDINREKIKLLNKNIIPFYEPKLLEMLTKVKENLKFTTDYEKGLENVEIVLLGIGTPNKKNGTVNLNYINNAIDRIMENLNNDSCIVIKSTVPIGTCDLIEQYIHKRNFKKLNIPVVSNPEFLSQGSAIKDFLHPSRIIVGTNDKTSINKLKILYNKLINPPYNIPFLVMERKSAEMVKYASNNYLALKLSYINEIANLCQKVGVNIDDITIGMGYDERIGKSYLNAGVGYGGSCLPKDTLALWNYSKKHNSEIKTIKSCIEVNKKQKIKLFNRLKEIYPNINGMTITILGLTFKPNTDDLREAPSMDNIIKLLEKGAIVNGYDPVCGDKCIEIIKDKLKNKNLIKNFKYFNDIDSSLHDAIAVLIMTEHEEIKKYDISKYNKIMKKPLILDGRNCYLPSKFNDTHIYYESIGRTKQKMI